MDEAGFTTLRRAPAGVPARNATHPSATERSRSDVFPSVPFLFGETARRLPDAVALRSADGVMSYRELAAAVDVAASVLASSGLRAGDRIGIRLGRRATAVVAILAAFRLGIAYVPLDPSHPASRHRAMIDEAGLLALVTDARADDVEEMRAGGLRVIDPSALSAAAGAFGNASEGAGRALDAFAMPGPDALAYVIFTSGSTGRPKGVAIRHGSLANLVRSMAAVPGMDAGDVLLATAPFAFDMSVPDLFLTLATGATLLLATEEEAVDGAALLALVARYGVTVMQSTPSRFRLMLEAGWPDERGTLRMLCGGEAISPAIAEALGRRGTLWNMYGPTETTVWSTARRLQPGTGDVAIGGPLHGTVLRVVDGDGAEVATGVIGELLIGGAGVAEGYVGRPELTAERFLTDRDGTRFYRTGDLVRPRADGALEFAGRNDQQIKLRGVRIEPGDVEAALRGATGVADAFVILHGPAGREVLAGYVVPHRDRPIPRAEAVAAHVATVLPSAMRPRIVVLDGFPLNNNGKLDRARLPVPPVPAGGTGDPPRDGLERSVAEIWCRVLGCERVGRDDDFLDLGGRSLDATRVGREIESVLGVRLAIASLIGTPVLADQARLVGLMRRGDRAAPSGAAPTLGELQVVSWNEEAGGAPVFGLHNLAPFRALGRALAGVCPFHAVALLRDGCLAGRRHARVEDAAAAYASAIRARAGTHPAIVLGWCAAGPIAIETVRQLRVSRHAVSLLVLVDPEPVGLPAWAMRETRKSWWSGRRLLGLAPPKTAPDATGNADEGGFDWLDRALGVYRVAALDVPILVVEPSNGSGPASAMRRRFWRRRLGADTRFVTATGSHAGLFAGDGAATIASLLASAATQTGVCDLVPRRVEGRALDLS